MSQLATAAAVLAGILGTNAPVTFVYTRPGVGSVTITGWLGQSRLKLGDPAKGFRIVWTDRDFLFPAAALVLGGSQTEPIAGDIIAVTPGKVGEGYFPASYGSGEPLFRYSDPQETIMRVHCKQYILPPPTITSISPSSCYLGGNQYTVITGTNLRTAQSVKFGNVPGQYIFVKSDTEIHTSPFPVSSAGPVNVAVTTLAGTATIPFTFNSATIAGTVTPLSARSESAYQGICNGNDGRLWWMGENGAGTAGFAFAMTTGGVVTAFPLGSVFSAANSVWAIPGMIAGSGGNLWTTDWGISDMPGPNLILRITPGGVVTPANLSPNGTAFRNDVYGICVGPDGNFWGNAFSSDSGGNYQSGGLLYKITDGLGVTSTPLALGAGYPIVAGLDGNLWLPDIVAGKLLQINLQGAIINAFNSFPAYPTAQPLTMCVGNDGNFWICDIKKHGVWRVSPSSPTTPTLFTTGFGTARPTFICAGPDGNVYAADQNITGKIYQVTPSGAVTPITVVAPGAAAITGICQGADGALYVTVDVTAGSYVARIA
jgi:hypothetical protein